MDNVLEEKEALMIREMRDALKRWRRQGGFGMEGIVLMGMGLAGAAVAGTMMLQKIGDSAKMSQETIQSNLEQAASALTFTGRVLAWDDDGDRVVDRLELSLSNYIALREGLDLTMTPDANGDGLLSDEPEPRHTTKVNLYGAAGVAEDLAWEARLRGAGNGDSILQSNEEFVLIVNLKGVPNILRLRPNDYFTLEVKPANGPPISLSRGIPAIRSSLTLLG
jgi:archaellin